MRLQNTSTHSIDAKLRLFAKRKGYMLHKKSGGFMIVDHWTRALVAGQEFDLDPEEVQDWIEQLPDNR